MCSPFKPLNCRGGGGEKMFLPLKKIGWCAWSEHWREHKVLHKGRSDSLKVWRRSIDLKDKKKVFMAELRKIAEEDRRHEKISHLSIQNWMSKSHLGHDSLGGRHGDGCPRDGIWKQPLHICRRRTSSHCKRNPDTQVLDAHHKPATRLLPQINCQCNANSSLPATTIMCSSAKPLQQKRTTFIEEWIRRLLRTRKQQSILNDYLQAYSGKFGSENLKRDKMVTMYLQPPPKEHEVQSAMTIGP